MPFPFFFKLGANKALEVLGIEPLPDIRKPETWTVAISDHTANVAGLHKDLRLIDPSTGHAHSWALPKAMLPEPGKAVFAIPQPTHTSDYVTSFEKERAEVFHATPDVPENGGTRVRFNLYKNTGPEEYAIVRTNKGSDILVNKTLTRERLPHLDIGSKPKLKQRDTYGGAPMLLDLPKQGKIPRLFAYRKPKRMASGVIEHTHKVPLLLNTRVPKDLANTSLRAETIAVTSKGKTIAAKDLAGLLNSGVEKSRAKQKELDVTLVPIAFDVTRYKGKDVTHLPFSERYKLLQEVSEKLHLPITKQKLDAPTKAKIAESRFNRAPGRATQTEAETCLDCRAPSRWHTEKTSEVVTQDLKEFQKTLRPGDILVSSMAPRKHPSFLDAPLAYAGETGFRIGSRLAQGSFTHAGMYDGRGHLIDIREQVGAPTRRPLSETKHLNIKAVRPNVSNTARQKALKRLRAHVAAQDVSYDLPSALIAGLNRFRKINPESVQKAFEQDRRICSSLVTDVFSDTPLVPDKPVYLALPVDLLKSNKVTPIALYTGKK